jgi:hypothetical protein
MAGELARRGITVTFLGKAELCAGMPSLEYIAKRAATWQFPVRTLTELGQPEALQYLRGGDKLAVMPSPFDNSPCTIYEALAAGIPFLAARTGGIPELVEKADRDRVLFDYATDALRSALEEALEQGGWIARPAILPEETRRSWKEMHAHWRELLPRAAEDESAARPATAVAIVDHPLGGQLARTLESLWACPQIHRIIILNRGGETLPHENIDLLAAETKAIEQELAGIAQDAVLLIHSGVAVLPDAFPRMLEALGRARVDGLVPAGRTTGSLGTRVVPSLGGSVTFGLLDGVTAGGAVVVTRELLRRALDGRALATESPFLGLADFCVTRSDRLWPYPEPVVERPESVAIAARSSLPARVAPYGETSANDRYYILAAGYEAATGRSPAGWMRPLALAAIDSGFSFAVRAAYWGRRRLRKWMRR